MDVTIVVATHGERHWLDLAVARATKSAWVQGCPVIYVHGLTLHGARNAGLAQVATTYVVFLDADDELQPGYCERLLQGTANLRVPSVQYVTPSGRPRAPYVPKVVGHTHDCEGRCLLEGNFAVIGSMVRVDMLRDIGAFGTEAIWEDWSVWRRLYLSGATVETIPEAVYIAHTNPRGRNVSMSAVERARVYREIKEAA